MTDPLGESIDGSTLLICIQYCPSCCMQKLTLPDVAWSNTVKQLGRCSRGNSEYKYILFFVQIPMQMNRVGLIPSVKQSRCRWGPAWRQLGCSRFLVQVNEYL